MDALPYFGKVAVLYKTIRCHNHETKKFATHRSEIQHILAFSETEDFFLQCTFVPSVGSLSMAAATNILLTAPQLSISQKALGTLSEDGSVMPKHVGNTVQLQLGRLVLDSLSSLSGGHNFDFYTVHYRICRDKTTKALNYIIIC
jgi:hypothetical protein